MKAIIRLWKHYLYDTKLVHKFFFLLLLLLLIEIIVSNFYIRYNAAELLTKEVRTTSRQFIEQYVDNIGYKLSKFNILLNSLSSNETIKQAFSEGAATDESYQEVDAAIRQILNNQFPYGLYDLTFYPLTKSIHGKSIFIRPLSEDTGSWKEKLADRYFDHYFMHTEGTYKTDLLSILKPVYSPDGTEITCVIKLSLFPEKVFKAMKGVDGEHSHQLFIIDTRGNYIYGQTFAGIDEYLSFVQDNYGIIYNGYPVSDFSDADGMYLTSTNSASGFRAVYYFAYANSLESIDTLNRTLTIGILILVCITLTAGILLSASVNKRFAIILEKIKTVSNGNLKIEDSHLGEDEIGIFDASFTQMVGQVNQLIENNYVIEMKKKDAEFMALQAQINPHFLFNSLEIINSLIEVERYDTACEVNSRLSLLLRYSINHNSSGIVTLAEEISYMNNYVYIQSIRFGNKFTFHSDIDEACLECQIIKLVFQPFIENSISHGFSGIPSGGNIWFSVKDRGAEVLISISDDGNGMEDADYRKLSALLEKDDFDDFQDQNESIGILNIHYRLKLKFGPLYRIRITTETGQGMKTELVIPKYGGKRYEAIDC